MRISNLLKAEYGDIILFNPRSFLSKIQVWIDNIGISKKHSYSHGAIFWGYENKIPLMVESVNNCGVHVTRVQEWKNYIIIRPEGYNITPKAEMARYLNRRYDFFKLLSIVLNKAFNIPLTVDDDSKVICTELINLAYYYALCPKGMCTPVTLANAIL
jgi:hypothetical protein